MNPPTATATATDEQLPAPPQPPLQPHRSSTSCDRHPDEHFTGFCPSCLCERLALLDKHSATTGATGPRKSTSSVLKSIFKPSTSSEEPAFRRTKSFSGGKNEGFLGFSGVFEPQRKSCDVKVRSTLWGLFSQDSERRGDPDGESKLGNASSSKGVASSIVIECKEEGEKEEEVYVGNETGNVEDEIEVVEEENSIPKSESGEQLGEILEEEKVDLKTMKDHIDLDSQNKKVGSKDFKELAGSFWSAASVFSKKLRSWTKKNGSSKLKKHNEVNTMKLSGKKVKGRGKFRDTQSEIADYGRRSCDTDPRLSLDAGRFSVDAGRFSVDAGRYSVDAGRYSVDAGRYSVDAGRVSVDAGRFSVDAGRMSFDDPRCSFEEPRASWDGYLIGKSFPRMMPPMVSVVEDPPVVVSRKDTQVPVEQQPRRSSVSVNDDENMPGGAAQTKDYYSDSSSRGRKSLDRSSSIRKTAAAVVAEMDEMKSSSNAKMSPASVDYFHGARVLAGDRDYRDSNSNANSLRDDCSESFDMGFRDNASVVGNGERKEAKKSKRWRAWNILGMIYRRGGNKDEEEDSYSRANGVERSFSESWPELRGIGYGDARASFSRNMLRSNSSVSWRNSYNVGGGAFGSGRKNSIDTNGQGRKKRDEFVLERNRSARYSPSHGDNGLLRFYLTPMRGSRRGVSGKPKPAYSHSIARTMLRLY